MKKIIALLLALSMLFALTACGEDNENTPPGESTGATTNTTESTNDPTDGTQGTTESTTGTETTEPPTTTPPTTTPPTTTPPTTTPPTTPPTTEAPHTHSYSAATCTAPAKCSCGATQGSALGHNFNAATCTTPKTCKTCGATEGSAAVHNWSNATCSAPKTCKTCGKTEGSKAGHNYQNGVCAQCSEPDPSNVAITFKDLFLESAIKSELNIQGRQITVNDMKRLSRIRIPDGAEDISDLKYAENLEWVFIDGSTVKNLNVLCDLQIENVSIWGLKIDVTFLKNMKSMTYLYFCYTEITGGSLNDIVSAPNLKHFYYSPEWGNNTPTLDFLQNGKSIEIIETHIYDTYDLAILQNLPNLKTVKLFTGSKSLTEKQLADVKGLMAKGITVEILR